MMLRIERITALEFKLFFRNWFNIVFALTFPLMMMLLYGSIYGNAPSAALGGHGTVDVCAPAYTCMTIAVTGLLCLPMAVARYRERKILKRFMATPIHPLDILLSQVFVNIAMAAVGMMALIAAGKALYNLQIFGQALNILAAFVCTALCMFSIGLVIAGVIPDSKAATAVSFLVYFPMLYLSGAIVPVQALPAAVQTVSKFIPLTYGVDLFENVWMGGSLSSCAGDVAVLLAVFAAFTLAAIKLFKWESV